jgi:prevent-host-death family protein
MSAPMTISVDIQQAKDELPSLVERAIRGEDVMIVDNGTPLVRLVPVSVPKSRRRRIPGRAKGKIWIGPNFEFTEEEISELFEGPLVSDSSP